MYYKKKESEFLMSILPIEPMSYKQQIKKEELITKLKIIRYVKRYGYSRKRVARLYSCHRHTVEKIIRDFEQKISEVSRDRLINSNDWRLEDLEEVLKPLLNKSRKPHRHSKQASELQEGIIVNWLYYETKIRIGPNRMKTLISRRFYDSEDPNLKSLLDLSVKQIRGIYKRYELNVKKVRSYTGAKVHIYDYEKLACFEHLHFDTKHILDQKSLPESIYEKFKQSDWMPRYQWTLQDAKSRFRFLAYSKHTNSEYGLKFLLFCLMYIRSTFNNWNTKITVGFDNGSENCSGSKRKLDDWNNILSLLKAKSFQYNLGNDIRKNLVERSHRSDDEEFYVPRASVLNDKKSFLEDATKFHYYFNFLRPHSGICMHNRTPIEVLKDSKLIRPDRLINFPIMNLEDNINTIRKTVDFLLYQAELNQNTKDLSEREKINIALKYDFFDNEIVQNVLGPYQHLILEPFN